MLTIAGGILLAVLLLVTIGVWLPLLVGGVGIALLLAVALAAIVLAVNFPEESLTIGVVFAVLLGVAYIINWLENWRKEKCRKKKILSLAKAEKENLSVPLERPKNDFIEPEEEKFSDPLEQLMNEFSTPGGLARSRNKNQMIQLANKFSIEVDENASKTDIARKIFDCDNESEDKTINNITSPDDSKSVVDVEKSFLLEQIEQAKKKEIVRLKDESKKAEEKKRKAEEPYIERFLQIKPSLLELKHAYSNDEDINVEIDDFSACLAFRGESDLLSRDIHIDLGDFDESFHITDSKYHYDDKEFNKPEEAINYIVEQLGKFLAERESE